MPKLEREFTVRMQVMVTPSTKKRIEDMALKLTPVWSKVHKRWQANESALLRRAISEFLMNHRYDPSVVDLSEKGE